MGPDFIPDGEFVPDSLPGGSAPTSHAPPSMQPAAAKSEASPDFIPEDPNNPEALSGSDEEKFGGMGQTALGVLEKAGQGFAGPIAPWLEVKSGLTTPEDIRLRTEQAGGLGTAGELVGFGLGAFTGMGEAALLGKLGEGAAAVSGLAKATGLGGKIAAGAVKGAAEMAALQGGVEATKTILKDPNQTATSAWADVGLSTILGTTMGAGFAAVPPLWTATAGPAVEGILSKIKADWNLGEPAAGVEHIVSPHVKRFLSIFGGVPPEQIEAYGANREAIKAAPEFSDLYAHTLDQLTDMAENIEVKKTSVAGAKSKFDSFLKEQKLALKQAGYDAGAADTMAAEALKQAQTRLATGLQEGAIEAAPRAFSAVEKLKTQALEASQSARDLLDQTPGELSLKPVFEAIRPMQDKLYSQGFPGMAEELGKQMDIFATQYGDKISYSNAKSMIQGLQKRGKWTFGANEMSNGLSPYFNQLSGIMNAELKSAIPAYAKAMEPTAEAFDLLNRLDKFGTPESSVKAALSLKNAANYTNEMPLLRALEAKSGVNFTNQLEHYANPKVRETMIKAMPEYESSLKTAEALEQLKNPEVRAALERAPYLSSNFKELNKAENVLQSAVERKSELAGLTPTNLEGRMRTAMAGKSFQARNTLGKLRGMPVIESPETEQLALGLRGFNDMSIPEILDLIHTREAFEKGSMNGSRNVNLWAKMLGGVGGVVAGLVGHDVTGAIAGTGLGAYVGGVLDKEGPAIVRNMLDNYLNKYGDLPKAVGASPEATRAGLLHFLGKDSPPDAKAFKSTINYIQAARKGIDFLEKSVKSLFEGGKTLPHNILPDMEKLKKLDERSQHLQENQQKMVDVGGGIGTYMPEHGQALAQSTMRAVNYINQYRPKSEKASFLDDDMGPTKEKMKEYFHGLAIAQQPLTIFQRIKDNSLVPQDLQILNALHPEYYGHMKQAVISAMTDMASKGEKIPFSMRQSLSLFVGQDLDSSFSPANILAAQATFINQRSGSQNPKEAPKKGSTNKLGEVADRYQTANQGAEARRARVQS